MISTTRSIPARLALALLLLAAAHPVLAQTPDVPAPSDATATGDPEPMLTPVEAYQRGLMPLAPTGVDKFRAQYPTYDGRGVIIGILDSGIDPGIPGLGTTSTGQRKILDLRDFSREGMVPLTRLTPVADRITVGGQTLTGVSRLKAIAGRGQIWGGTLRERGLGDLPASDINGDRDNGDTLAVVVVRASDGWVLFADTDGDGSLANEKPVHDYLVARETFGWHSGTAAVPVNLAVNLSEVARAPRLNLFFDTSGHGSHVAGIASAHDMYGVKGFDGVAPGAFLLGLKVSNNAQGGISTTGSMLAALDYAITFAAKRRLPLVLNMSFGVGNEVEGTARIDAAIDSVLALHPELVFAISAGNDGPGLTTMGFPGSALRALTIGATYPGVFTGSDPSQGDPVAFFSSRGGELAKPDIVTPGMAFSTVPHWNIGDEQKGGTSMASPHATGLVALLRSALAQSGKTADARQIRQALMVTARPVAGTTYLDEGTGQPEIGSAWRWLQAARAVPDIQVRAADHGVTAAWRVGRPGGADTVQQFLVTLPKGAALDVTLRSTAPWLRPPAKARLMAGSNTVALSLDAGALTGSGMFNGVVTAWTADTLLGPVFRLVTTVIVPDTGATIVAPLGQLPASGVGRLYFQAEKDRPFAVIVGTREPRDQLTAYLHEPGGQPYREGNGIPAGAGERAGLFVVDGGDVVPGLYQAVAVASPQASATPSIAVQQSPFRIMPVLTQGSVSIGLQNLSQEAVATDPFVVVIGGEKTLSVTGGIADTGRVNFSLPTWAVHAVVDVTMEQKAWSRFTDFGVTLFDADGEQLGQAPLNYDRGRLQLPLPQAREKDEPVELDLFPGVASASDRTPWTAQVRIRLYADSSHVTQMPGSATTVAAGASMTSAVPYTPPALPLGEGFVPLGVAVVPENERAWTVEFPLKVTP